MDLLLLCHNILYFPECVILLVLFWSAILTYYNVLEFLSVSFIETS